MAGDTVTLALHGPISLDQFAQGVQRFHALIRALSDEAHLRGVTWQIEDLQVSSAVATARGVASNGTKPAEIERVVRNYLEVGQSLESGELVPFSKPVQTEATGIAALLKIGVEAVRFETAESDATVREAVAEVQAPTPKSREAFGAVTGRVQTLTSRSELRFTLYDRLHDRAVSCYLKEGGEPQMREMWDRVATVEGWVTRDYETGRPLAVRRVAAVTPIEEVGPQDYMRARGAVPPEGEQESAEAVIRRLRDAW